jgi:hypothetical protein
MWDLWWTTWHWDRFSPSTSVFSCQFHSIGALLQGEMKKSNIFITGLHNKPQGCGASVASAAEPFTKKKKILQIQFKLQVRQRILKILITCQKHSSTFLVKLHSFYYVFQSPSVVLGLHPIPRIGRPNIQKFYLFHTENTTQSNPIITTSVHATPSLLRQISCCTN